MSLKATTWALYETPNTLDAVELRLLLIIADNTDDYGRGFAKSNGKLAELAGISKRTVQTKLANLKNLGLIRAGNQKLVSYLAPNRRPVVYDLCMPRRHADFAPQSDAVEITDTDTASAATSETPVLATCSAVEPQRVSNAPDAVLATSETPVLTTSDSGVQLGCNRGETGVQQGCNRGESMVAHNTINPIETIETRENAPASKTDTNRIKALAEYRPDEATRKLASEYGLDLDAELRKYRDHRLSHDRIPKGSIDADFRLWLQHGAENGYGTPATPAPQPKQHQHTWRCRHVLDLLHRTADIAMEVGPDDTSCRLANLLNQGKTNDEALAALGLHPDELEEIA